MAEATTQPQNATNVSIRPANFNTDTWKIGKTGFYGSKKGKIKTNPGDRLIAFCEKKVIAVGTVKTSQKNDGHSPFPAPFMYWGEVEWSPLTTPISTAGLCKGLGFAPYATVNGIFTEEDLNNILSWQSKQPTKGTKKTQKGLVWHYIILMDPAVPYVKTGIAQSKRHRLKAYRTGSPKAEYVFTRKGPKSYEKHLRNFISGGTKSEQVNECVYCSACDAVKFAEMFPW